MASSIIRRRRRRLQILENRVVYSGGFTLLHSNLRAAVCLTQAPSGMRLAAANATRAQATRLSLQGARTCKDVQGPAANRGTIGHLASPKFTGLVKKLHCDLPQDAQAARSAICILVLEIPNIDSRDHATSACPWYRHLRLVATVPCHEAC